MPLTSSSVLRSINLSNTKIKALSYSNQPMLEEIIINGSYIENIGYNIKYYDDMWAEIK